MKATDMNCGGEIDVTADGQVQVKPCERRGVWAVEPDDRSEFPRVVCAEHIRNAVVVTSALCDGPVRVWLA